MTETEATAIKARILRCRAANEKRWSAHNAKIINDLAERLYYATGYFFANGEWLKAPNPSMQR